MRKRNFSKIIASIMLSGVLFQTGLELNQPLVHADENTNVSGTQQNVKVLDPSADVGVLTSAKSNLQEQIQKNVNLFQEHKDMLINEISQIKNVNDFNNLVVTYQNNENIDGKIRENQNIQINRVKGLSGVTDTQKVTEIQKIQKAHTDVEINKVTAEVDNLVPQAPDINKHKQENQTKDNNSKDQTVNKNKDNQNKDNNSKDQTVNKNKDNQNKDNQKHKNKQDNKSLNKEHKNVSKKTTHKGKRNKQNRPTVKDESKGVFNKKAEGITTKKQHKVDTYTDTEDTTEVTKYTPNMSTTDFINKIGGTAQQLAHKNDLYASVMIAQAILESGSGSSGLAQAPNYNLFGIKGNYRGHSVSMMTQEDDGSGDMSSLSAGFRKYPGYKESLQDYIDLLKFQPIYQPVFKNQADTYKIATAYLQGHYATDSHYAQSLNGIIQAYDLTRYDGAKAVGSTSAINEKSVKQDDISSDKGSIKLLGDPSKSTYRSESGQLKYDKQHKKVKPSNLATSIQMDTVDPSILTKQRIYLNKVHGKVSLPFSFNGQQTVDSNSYAGYLLKTLQLDIPDNLKEQYDASQPITKNNLQSGDLVFFKNTEENRVPREEVSGVGVYVGHNKYVHVVGSKVEQSTINDTWTQAHILSYGRIIE